MKRVRDTSALALRSLDLPRREQIVLTALQQWTGPAPTSYELTRWLQADDLAFDVNSCRPRISALVDKGLVVAGPRRACRVTGKSAYTWLIAPARQPDPEPLSFTWEVA